jgi:uncharacterized linocin/CFP29 family protein
MDPALANYGWTEDQWNRLCSSVTEEAQRSRVAAQLLPSVGPEDPATLAIPRYSLTTTPGPVGEPALLATESDPDLYLTRIGVTVQLRSHEVADPTLSAALAVFRRAANAIARAEDALLFYGRRNTGLQPVSSELNVPPPGQQVFDITQDRHNVEGVFRWPVGPSVYEDAGPALPRGALFPAPPLDDAFYAGQQARGGSLGDGVVNTIVSAIGVLEDQGYPGPFACALSSHLFEAVCTPAPTLVLPRDRLLPFLQGPLLRASALEHDDGVVISLAGSPVEIVFATDIQVRFLQQTLDSRWAFRVSERVALRIKDAQAIARIRS